MSEPVTEILTALARPDKAKYIEIGRKLGRLYTESGFPVDMALDRLENLDFYQKLNEITGVGEWLLEHKRNSGATEKSIERQRKFNRDMAESFIKTGETGVY